MKQTKRIWLTTDTHFNHKKMMEYCGRPENFNDLIEKGLKSIPEDDILLHLGDICIGNDRKAHEQYIEPLKCKKWLVRGNHDKKSNSWYLKHGWDFVGNVVGGNYFGKKIIFSHEPKYYHSFDLNIHGHMHNSNHRKYNQIYKLFGCEHRLLAIEYTEYQPVLLETFLR